MLISFECPHCQASLRAGSNLAGKEGACPHCRKKVTVPQEYYNNQNDSGGKNEFGDSSANQ